MSGDRPASGDERLREVLPCADDLDLALSLVDAVNTGHPQVPALLAEVMRRPLAVIRLASLVAPGATHDERHRRLSSLSLSLQLVDLGRDEP